MAFRIHESVVRGEIDNRVRGIVRGKIWIAGRDEPVLLELKGNAWPDLAGCLLTFVNPLTPDPHQHLESMRSLQRGSIGDLTASRKVMVFDVPLKEALAMIRRKEKPPEHMANSIYLEWYSEANGRVVIESADYELTISAPEWRLTPEEDAERAIQAGEGMVDFMQKLGEAVQAQGDYTVEKWDEHDYETFLRECDARTEKYGELLEKYGDSEEGKERIAEEMGWNDANDDKEGENNDDEKMSIEEMNEISEAAIESPPEPDPHLEGIVWIRDEAGFFRHPLQYRCTEGAVKFGREIDRLGLDPAADRDLDQFISEFEITGTKLAGALNGIAEGAPNPDPAFTVAYLKRALGHLHAAQAGLEAVASKSLLPQPIIVGARQELFEIREEILQLMDRYRGR